MVSIFHIHVYFDVNQLALAEKVRENIIQNIPQLTYKGQLIPMPIGPHTKPMFELHVPAEHLNDAKVCLNTLREGLSILIHPVQYDELDAHTHSATWLGAVLPLKLEVLPNR
jgi:aromatic ring-cleaving dioxygenase